MCTSWVFFYKDKTWSISPLQSCSTNTRQSRNPCKVSNKILWSIVNSALRPSLTRGWLLWSSMFSEIYDCTFRSAVFVLWNGLCELIGLMDPDATLCSYIWSPNWLTDAFSVSLDSMVSYSLVGNLGKQVQGLAFLWEVSGGYIRNPIRLLFDICPL